MPWGGPAPVGELRLVRGVVAVVPNGVSRPAVSLSLEEYASWTQGRVGLPWIASHPDAVATTLNDPAARS